MNLPNTRSVQFLLLICLLFLMPELVVIGIGAFRLSAESTQLRRLEQRLSRLYARELFPSEANIEKAAKQLDELDYLVNEFGAELKRDPFPPDAADAAVFSARAQDVVERFQQKAERSGVKLPVGNEAGFSAYTSGGVVPDIKDVPRLTRQLYSVERVANVLVGSGVTAIERLARDVFEGGGAADRRRRSDGSRGMQSEASEVHPSGICFVEKIEVSFTADERTVWRVLDSFTKAPHFMVVAEFSHRSGSDILQYNPDVYANQGPAGLTYLSGGILTGGQAQSREERIVAGKEPVRVDLVVDVYNFDRTEGGL